MTPHEQAHKLVEDYYTIINGSPQGEIVNEEALSEAIERAREEVLRTMNWVGSGNYAYDSILVEYEQVLDELKKCKDERRT